jgi:hypothetical protein
MKGYTEISTLWQTGQIKQVLTEQLLGRLKSEREKAINKRISAKTIYKQKIQR